MTLSPKPKGKSASGSVVDRMQALVSEDLVAVEQILAARAASPVAVIPDLSGYIVSAGGKRLRPMLTLMAAHAVGKPNPATHVLAAAVEFIHRITSYNVCYTKLLRFATQWRPVSYSHEFLVLCLVNQ